MPPAYPMPSSFWPEFLEKYWRKRPAVFKQPFSGPLATPAEVFQGFVGACHRMFSGDLRMPVRVYMDGMQISSNFLRYVPDPADGSTDGWLARMGEQVNHERRFGVIANNFQATHENIHARTARFLEGLYEHIGVPAGGTMVDLFIGNYKQSFFGLHKDVDDIFTSVVEGRKRMLVWPFETFLGEPGMSEAFRERNFYLDDALIEKYREQAIVLEGEAGDFFYWPQSYWHIAESDGTRATTLAVSLSLGGNKVAGLMPQAASRLMQELLPAESLRPGARQESLARASEVSTLVGSAVDEAVRGGAFHRAAASAWLGWQTGQGFAVVPEPGSAEGFGDEALLRVVSPRVLAWADSGRGELVCSANGHATPARFHPALVELLGRLSQGGEHRVRELLAEVTKKGGSTEDARALLRGLYTFRAFERLG